MSATTTHKDLRDWVDEWAAIFQPAAIEWCDGSVAEYDRAVRSARRGGHLHAARRQAAEQLLGALRPGRRRPCRGPHLHLLRATRIDAGPTNNWRDPAEMQAEHARASSPAAMQGRTMYVVPFSMGPLGSPIAHIGVQLTDSAYVAVTMRIMTRMGQAALDVLGATASSCRACTRSARRSSPARPTCRGRATPRTSTSSTSPRPARSGRYGSGYGGNALLGKKCFALRIASSMARDDGWMAEHMLILKLTSPERREEVRRRRVPVGVRQDQHGHDHPDPPGLEGRDRRRRHLLDEVRRRRPALRHQPRGRLLRRRPRHRRRHQPQRHDDARRATASSPTPRSPTTATCGGRA